MQEKRATNRIEIVSPDNKAVKLAASLAEKKHRDALGMYLVEGPNLVREALQQGIPIRFIFTGAEALSRRAEIEEILQLAENSGSAVCVLSERVFGKVSDTQTAQGIAAVCLKKAWREEDLFFPGSCVLVCDRIQDPGNLGTLLRTAESCGFSGALLLKGCADPYGPKAVRSSAGCVFRFPVLLCESAGEALDMLARQRKRVWTAHMEGAPCWEAPLGKDIALVVGNEGNGADDAFLKGADRVSIPMEGQAESLNAAVACGILMYESLRQRAAGGNK
ncbi:MAG: RNA methyltransferase [Clostridia bacterium]|nr:RNA methyltransferase [Clostridia bacterium]